jgi:hypothetical protein
VRKYLTAFTSRARHIGLMRATGDTRMITKERKKAARLVGSEYHQDTDYLQGIYYEEDKEYLWFDDFDNAAEEVTEPEEFIQALSEAEPFVLYFIINDRGDGARGFYRAGIYYPLYLIPESE